MDTSQASVLGAGSYGTVIAQLLAANGVAVRLWCRRQEVADSINAHRRNPDYLNTLQLHENVSACTDIAFALRHTGLVVLAVPGKEVHTVLEQMRDCFTDKHFIVSTAKGIASPGFRLMHELIEVFLVRHGFQVNQYAVLGGPNIASEIAEQKIAAAVIASRNRKQAHKVASMLSTPYFLLYHNPDIFGVELAGALKNIYAIVSGLSDANNMGDNTKSALVCRAVAEISKFSVQLGANPMTFIGLAGVGDLIVTCFSPKSRNYQFGYALASGKSIDEIMRELPGVAEGVNTLKEVHKKAIEIDVQMPLVQGIYEIIYQGQNYLRVLRRLVATMQEADVEFSAT